MTFSHSVIHISRLVRVILLLIISVCLVGACAKKLPEPEGFFSDYEGPQIAVTPTTAKLGITTLLKTQIVIGGRGFQPGDTVFVDLIGVSKTSDVKIPVDSMTVSGDGTFAMLMSEKAKKDGILKMETDPVDGKPVVVRDPISPGMYYFRAISVNSNRKAECLIEFVPPGKMDRFKDKLASWFGKIRIRR